MPKFNVVVPHDLQRTEVVERLQGFAVKVREDTTVELTEVSEHWDESGNLEFSFKAMGMQVSGSLVASSSEVKVDGTLPFAAALFRGTIETQIAEKIREAIVV